MREFFGKKISATMSGDENTTTLLVTLQRARVKEMEKMEHHKVGLLHPAVNYHMPTSINISEMLMKIISDNGLRGCDLSDDLSPNMTTYEFALWRLKLFQGLDKHPDTIFFVTCDIVKSIEGLLYMDDEMKICSMMGFVKCYGDAQAFAWRGEDYVRIANLQGFSRPLQALRQVMNALTDPGQECAICMEVINDDLTVDGVVTGRNPFTCMHTICRKCYEKTEMKSCPICRCKETFKTMINQISDKGKKSKKGKKKMSAAARRSR